MCVYICMYMCCVCYVNCKREIEGRDDCIRRILNHLRNESPAQVLQVRCGIMLR